MEGGRGGHPRGVVVIVTRGGRGHHRRCPSIVIVVRGGKARQAGDVVRPPRRGVPVLVVWWGTRWSLVIHRIRRCVWKVGEVGEGVRICT